MIAYFFSMVGYIFFAPRFIADQVRNVICCDSLTRCIICIIDTTFMNGGGLGAFFYTYNPMTPTRSLFDYPIYIYQTFALILMVIILIELLNATIIDTFGALRERDAIEKFDKEGSCFICGLTVSAFEKAGSLDFQTHIKKEHYMWNYVNFLAHLEEKNPEDFDGIEQYVYIASKKLKIDWIPHKQCLGLAGGIDIEENLRNIHSNDEYIEHLPVTNLMLEGLNINQREDY